MIRHHFAVIMHFVTSGVYKSPTYWDTFGFASGTAPQVSFRNVKESKRYVIHNVGMYGVTKGHHEKSGMPSNWPRSFREQNPHLCLWGRASSW